MIQGLRGASRTLFPSIHRLLQTFQTLYISLDPTAPRSFQNNIFVDPAASANLQDVMFADPAAPRTIRNIIFVGPAAPANLLDAILRLQDALECV